MDDRIHQIKSSAKLYIEDLQDQLGKPDCPIPEKERPSYRVMLSAGHNAVNGGSENISSLSVALGSMICAMTEDKLNETPRMLTVVEANRKANCPWEGVLQYDKMGKPVLPSPNNADSFNFASKWFSISTNSKVGIILAAVIVIMVFYIGSGVWRKVQTEDAVKVGIEQAIQGPPDDVPPAPIERRAKQTTGSKNANNSKHGNIPATDQGLSKAN